MTPTDPVIPDPQDPPGDPQDPPRSTTYSAGSSGAAAGTGYPSGSGDPYRAPMTAEDERRAVALRNLRSRREFVGHLTAYLLVNAMLVAIWLTLGLTVQFWFFWPIFPLCGWGIGLAFHAIAAFGRGSRPITEADIQAEMRRLEQR